MRKLWVLLKINFRSLLAALSMGSSSRKKVRGTVMLITVGILIMFLSCYYCVLGGYLLNMIDAIDYLFPIAAFLSCCASLLFTVFCATGVVFGGRDMDLMLSLPIQPFFIMLSKLLALYLENFMFCAVIMIPAAFVQLYWQGRISAGYWIAVALIVVLVASLPTLFSTLIGCVISFLSSRLKHKALVANILYLGVFLAIFAGIFSLQMRLTNKLPTRAELSNFVVNWLYPFELIHRAILGDGWAFFIFLLGVLVPFLLIIYLFSAKYQKILAGLVPYAGKSDYQMKRIGISAPFNALFQKEWKRYFGCPVYVANTLLGPIFLLVGGIGAIYLRADLQILLAQTGMEEFIPQILSIAAVFILSITCTTHVSISMEGKNLWILKASPLTPMTVFGAKIALQLVIIWPAVLIAGLCVTIAFHMSLLDATLLFFLCLSYSMMTALWGLVVNLTFPKMDCENDTVIVKQSASAMIVILGGMLLTAIIGVFVWFTQTWIPFFVQAGILSMIFTITAILCGIWLSRNGERRLLQI